jgi:apolipoprotein N-acyltransferase
MKGAWFVILGAAASLAFPPYNMWFLVILFVFPIREAIKNNSISKGFQAGLFFGLGLFFVGTYWIYLSLYHYGGQSVAISLGLVFFLCVPLSFSLCLGNLFLSILSRKISPLYLIFIIVIIFSLLELVRGSLLGGFSWFSLYHSQLYGPFRGLFPIFGSSGVSFIILYLIGSVAVMVDATTVHKKVILTSMSLVFIFSMLVFEIQWTKSINTGYQFSLIQGGFSQEERLSFVQRHSMQSYYLDTVNKEIEKADIVILPEGSLLNTSALSKIPTIEDKLVITGILELTDNNAYNTIVAVSDKKQLYRKRFLVPFGEYIPGGNLINNWFTKLRLPIPAISSGQLAQEPFIFNEIIIGTTICFEDTFSKAYTSYSRSNVFINLTNDAWFIDSKGLDQHFSFSQIRALEYGKYTLRVANTGVTAYIGPDGEVIDRLRTIDQNILRGNLIVSEGSTPYGLFGSLPLLGFFLILFIAQSIMTKLRIF